MEKTSKRTLMEVEICISIGTVKIMGTIGTIVNIRILGTMGTI
jgi:hypothetical protein